jgi:hypothetical protein
VGLPELQEVGAKGGHPSTRSRREKVSQKAKKLIGLG